MIHFTTMFFNSLLDFSRFCGVEFERLSDDFLAVDYLNSGNRQT